MKRWIAEPTNLVLAVAIVTTGVGLVATFVTVQGTGVLAFAGSLWVVWSTVLKERRRRNGKEPDD